MKWTICTLKAHQQHKDELSKLSSGERLLEVGATNGLLMNKEGAGQMEAQQSCNTLQWTNLNTEEACSGRMSAIKLHALFILGEISHKSVSYCFNTMPLHPPHYEVLINWAGVRQNGLTSWIIALALSSLPHTEATGHIHLVPSQPPRSLVYTSLGQSLLCIS